MSSDAITTRGHSGRGRLTRGSFLKAGAAAGAGLAALASPLGARGAALAAYSRRLAARPLDATQPIHLKFMIRGGAGYHAFFYKAGEIFAKRYPNVSISYEIHDEGYATKLKVEMAGGVPPDLVFGADDQMFSFAARGALVDMAPFFKADGLKKADFWPAAMDPQWLGDHLFAMPLDYGLDAVAYNKAKFDQQHQSYPTANWTWTDFLQVARNLTLDRNGKRASDAGFQPAHVVQYASDSDIFWAINNVLRGNGAEWASPDLTRATLDSPAAVSTFQFVADLGNKYYINPGGKFVTSVSFGFMQNNAAMAFMGTWDFSGYPNNPQLKWAQGNIDIVGAPIGTKKRGVGAEASGLIIPTGTKPENVRWAWELIKWMTTDPGQRVAFAYGVASIPNSPKLAHELISRQRLPSNARLILELLPQAQLPYWCEAISDADLENILQPPFSGSPELYDLYRGRKTAAQVMPAVNKKVQALLDKDQATARTLGARLTL